MSAIFNETLIFDQEKGERVRLVVNGDETTFETNLKSIVSKVVNI